MYLKSTEKSSVEKIRSYLIDIDSYDKYLLDNLFIGYLKKYNQNSQFLDISFIYNESNNRIFCPITIEKKNNKKYLNYIGYPIKIFSDYAINKDQKNNFLKILDELTKKSDIRRLSLCLEIKKNNHENYLIDNKNTIQSIYEDSIIDLSLTENEIFKQISKGHKSELKKNKNKLVYKIINSENYSPNLINKMMSLHIVLAGKQTRSAESWLENEKMIIQKKGFLICVVFDGKVISYSFFFHNDLTGIYFTSCTDRRYFSYAGITHNSIWQAIKYLKKIGCKYFYIGKVKTLYSKDPLTEKEKNIERFKKSFGGMTKSFVIYNNVPKKI